MNRADLNQYLASATRFEHRLRPASDEPAYPEEYAILEETTQEVLKELEQLGITSSDQLDQQLAPVWAQVLAHEASLSENKVAEDEKMRLLAAVSSVANGLQLMQGRAPLA